MKIAWLLLPLSTLNLHLVHAASTDDPLFPLSAVTLMPEGEPADVAHFKPLNPTVMAWGLDPVFQMDDLESLRDRFDAYRRLGVYQRAVNVWMLTATSTVLHHNPIYQDAVCLDIAGDRIIPAWLADGDHEGTPAYWGCTNHPLFRQQVIDRARAGIEAGGNLLHLDDHMGTAAAAVHAGGCFCDPCMEGFRNWLRSKYTAEELVRLGVDDPDRFDYRAVVRQAGFDTLERYQTGASDYAIPLRKPYLTYQREAAANYVAELRSLARAVAGHPVPIGVNAWNLAPTQMATAHHADYFANEIQHYGREDLVPPTSYLLATALGKPVFSTGTGEDWIEVGDHGDVVRIRRWIAMATAFGHYFMYSHRKWGYSPETGTRWYTTPIATYKPLTDFITAHSELLDGYTPLAQIGVIYSNEACRGEDWSVREVTRSLLDAGYSCGFAIAGDEWLLHELAEADLDAFENIVVPFQTPPAGAQGTLIRDRLRSGQAVSPDDFEALKGSIVPWIIRDGPGRLWVLPRTKAEGSHSSLVVHLLNQEFDPATDSMIPNKGSSLSISHRLTGGRPPEGITLHTPDCESRDLEMTSSTESSSVRLPEIELWSILQVRVEPVPPKPTPSN